MGVEPGGAVSAEVSSGSYFIDGPWPPTLAWLAFVVVSLGVARNAFRHLLSYNRPDLQQHILRIIMVGPLYAFCAALCLCMEESACLMVRSVRDIWEAVVIYSFLTLIIEYMGGEHLCLHSISQREEAVPHLFPMNLCLPPLLTGSMIRVPKMAALQFVALKPLAAFLSIVVYASGHYEDWLYQWSIFIVYNISYTLALYGLYLMYWAVHEHPALQAKKPLLKFLSVKMIVFLTFWQAVVLPHAPLPGSTRRWEDFILALEMVLFGFLMNTAYSWKEFHSGMRGSKGPNAPNSMNLGSKDLLDLDVDISSQPGATGQPAAKGQPVSFGRRSEVVQNAKAAFDPRDIILDASSNFSRRYQQHVLIESAQEYELHSEEALEAQVQLQKQGLPPIVSPDAPQLQQQPAGNGGANPKTFRARTYLFGRSLGLGGGKMPAAGMDATACGGGAEGAGAVAAAGEVAQAPAPVAVGAVVDAAGPAHASGAAEAGAISRAAEGETTLEASASSTADAGSEDASGAVVGGAEARPPRSAIPFAAAAERPAGSGGGGCEEEAAGEPGEGRTPLGSVAPPLHKGFGEEVASTPPPRWTTSSGSAIGEPAAFGNPFS